MGVVYGLKTETSRVLYVGQTVGLPATRLSGHLANARSGHGSPVYVWMREVGLDEIKIIELEKADDDRLLEVEEAWMITLATSRDAGGLNELVGPRWSTMSRIERRQRWIEIGRIATADPAVRARMSELAQARATPESRARTSEQMRERYRDSKTRNEMRERSRRTMLMTTHTRWHTNRGIVKPGCALCG